MAGWNASSFLRAGSRRGRGVRRVPGQMNSLERQYAEHLQTLQATGEIRWFAFDALKLRLADNTFYTPDFLVMMKDDTLELHEVKGFWEDDARVKIKVCADKYPFRLRAITKKAKKDGGGWKFEEFGEYEKPSGKLTQCDMHEDESR